jgi:hypothetical protein
MLPLVFESYGCDPLLGHGSTAGGHPVVYTEIKWKTCLYTVIHRHLKQSKKKWLYKWPRMVLVMTNNLLSIGGIGNLLYTVGNKPKNVSTQ